VPLLTRLPTLGLIDQVTPVLLVPETVAVNVCCCDGRRETAEGVKEIFTGVFTVKLRAAELCPTALVAVTVKLETLCAVAVPLMTPVEAFRLSPAGREPPVTAHVIGALPEALSAVE
jgi:hypothetical protein